jgi:hypothetical protein
VNRPKAIGTAAETALVRHARGNGFPNADRLTLSGTSDRGDLRLTTGLTAGVVVESKAGNAAMDASDAQIGAWLDETERERVNAGAAVALLVTKRRGYGAARCGHWWAHVRLSTLDELADDAIPVSSAIRAIPVRMTLDDALRLLRAAGYGDPLAAVTP